MASMIAAVCWVPRGAANPVPVTAEPTDEELEAMKLALEELSHGKSDGEDGEDDEGQDYEDEEMDGESSSADPVGAALAAAKALGGNESKVDVLASGLADLDMDHYDDEDEGPDAGEGLYREIEWASSLDYFCG